MNIRDVIRSDIEASIKKAGLEAEMPVQVTYPTEEEFGDYASNWPLQVSGALKHPAGEIAKKIQSNLEKSDIYEPVEVAEAGFLNFKLKREFLAKNLKLALAEGERFGASASGKGKKVLIEYSSPNIAKPMHVGHLRNTNLGLALTKIISFNGYQTITDNHIGDWGTQFGKLIYAYKKWGQDLTSPGIDDLLRLYVRFHDEAKTDPTLETAAREEFRQLEAGDKENRGLWEKFRILSVQEFEQIYHKLGAKFDHQYGESFYEKDLPEVVGEALKSGVARRDPDNSVVIPLEGMPPFLILKSDGATLYGTRDLATARYRVKQFSPDLVLYVIGAEQTLYLRQLFAALSKLGWGGETGWRHISYGLTRLPQGKLSTRSGDLVTAEEIISEAKERAAKVIGEKDQTSSIDPDLIEAIAIGAIKWNDLRVSRAAEVSFNWDQIFNFEGDSGPYVQYSYARTRSILAKAGRSEPRFDEMALREDAELKILRQLVRFPEVVEQAAIEYEPHLICRYAFELAQNFSRFYEEVPVLTAEESTRQARLALVAAVGQNLQVCLTLLGINAPERL